MNFPAFPANHFDLAEGEHGMTLRDYFAAHALQGLLAVPVDSPPGPDLYARAAYLMADAMLKERAK